MTKGTAETKAELYGIFASDGYLAALRDDAAIDDAEEYMRRGRLTPERAVRIVALHVASEIRTGVGRLRKNPRATLRPSVHLGATRELAGISVKPVAGRALTAYAEAFQRGLRLLGH